VLESESEGGQIKRVILIKVVLLLFFRPCERICENLLGVIYMKAIDRILWLAYGNHPQTSEYKEKAQIILNRLRRDSPVEKSVLMEEVGLDPSVESDDRKFKRILQPLKGDKDNNPMDISFLHSFQKGDDRYYALSRSAFDSSLKPVIRNIRYCIETKPEEELIQLQEKVEELRKKNKQLQEK